jgi:hypothetical protein
LFSREADLDDPIVGLFLLICDLAINPTRGFPLDIEHFDHFINDVDVAVRFTVLSLAVPQLPHLRSAIQGYSREEYVEVSEELQGTRFGSRKTLPASASPGTRPISGRHAISV